MKLCITGAFGYIGSRLIRNLSIKGLEKVYLVDNLSVQGHTPFYLFNLPDNNFIFEQLDILSERMEQIVKECDVVVHLAAYTNAEASVKAKEMAQRNNTQGTAYIASLCCKYGKSLVFPSTTSIYATLKNIVSEDCEKSDIGPQSPYGESKLKSEKHLQNLAKDKKLSCVILRFGSMFGYSVGIRLHTVINKFIWQAVNGQELKIWTTALDQRRPYCALEDGISAINYVINKKIFDGNIYNIVTTNVTVKEILGIVKNYVPEIKIKLIESAIMNNLSYIVSNEKSLRRGFTYKGDLKKDILKCMQELKNVNFTVRKNFK